MTLVNSANALNIETPMQCIRKASIGDITSVLTDIYNDEVNIAIWRNSLTSEVIDSINDIMNNFTRLRVVTTTAPGRVSEHLLDDAPELSENEPFVQYVDLLVDMFCTLFELKHVGLRLSLLDHAMCPKFHVDKIPCRMITTFSGVATEWLEHSKVNRNLLGAGSLGIPDEESGIYLESDDIQKMTIGDVALLKGEGWFDNENAGLVHRSPSVKQGEKRLLLTLDFID